MSKVVSELLEDLAEQSQIEDSFDVHVLKVVISEEGEVEESAQAMPVTQIAIDEAEQECYLYFEEEIVDTKPSKAINVGELKASLKGEIQDYMLFAAQEKETDEAVMQLTTPLIGSGENEATQSFFVICQA